MQFSAPKRAVFRNEPEDMQEGTHRNTLLEVRKEVPCQSKK